MIRLDTTRLGALVIRDIDGRPVTVRSAWEARPALLVFLRHFG